MNTILLVEDDEALAYGIEYSLKNEGFLVTRASSLSDARKEVNKNKFNLILLDVKLPDGSGFNFCWEIRSLDIPIIFLTACDEEVNIVLGLDMGADDYITKPFRIRELISRIKAVLRRSQKKTDNSKILVSDDIKIYTLEGKVKKRDEEVLLTTSEYKLLLVLVKNANHILSRNMIIEKLWDIDGEFIDDNTLSVYIRRLREKIEDNPPAPKYIVTVRGVGYKWDLNVRGEI